MRRSGAAPHAPLLLLAVIAAVLSSTLLLQTASAFRLPGQPATIVKKAHSISSRPLVRTMRQWVGWVELEVI